MNDMTAQFIYVWGKHAKRSISMLEYNKVVMYKLPLFPLNTVLFPGTPLNLHIFEPRYKEMITMCIDQEKPFGIALIKHGIEAFGELAQPYSVGCTARIIQIEHLDQDQMNIIAVGERRFRIQSLDAESFSYLVGKVDDYPLTEPSPSALRSYGDRLRRRVKRYIGMLINAGGVDFDLEEIPDEPLPLAYMAAAILQLSAARKQALLSLEDGDDLLARLSEYYRHEIALLRVALTKSGVGSMPGGFSIN
jgi:Lon protease-like protein